MAAFNFQSINSALNTPKDEGGVDFTGKSLKLDTENDAKPITEAIDKCPNLHHLTLTGNTLGVAAAQSIAKSLEQHPELKLARWSDMFTGRMKTEIPPALSALGDGMIAAGTRLTVLDLSDNAFGPIGVEGLAKLLQSAVCSELQELRLNNNGLGITGGKLLAKALSSGKPPKLRTFIAGRNRLENEGATALAGVFQKMGSLEEIAMPQNGIYHVGIKALSQAFSHNLSLRSLNLNDNTIGPKGAVYIAEILPKLKNLKEINFGDCLLKSKGALALAKGFRDNSTLLETLDLSQNEIGRVACLEIVNCITMLPDYRKRLTKVVLAGNSMGENKSTMKAKLGDCGVLSDGEGSDEEYVTGSEDESDAESDDQSGDGSDSDESATIDQNSLNVDETLTTVNADNSGVEEVKSDVENFLKYPTLSNLNALGSNCVEVIDAHLQAIKDPVNQIQAYVEATLKISGLTAKDSKVHTLATQMYPVLIRRAGERHAHQWALANSMLVGLGLIKSENKSFKVQWDLEGCFEVLNTVLKEDYFPVNLKDTLTFFIKAKKDTNADK